MDLGLKDKKVILSGGSKGIGFYTAKLLASEGCKVAFCSRNSESLKRAETEINSISEGSAKGITANLESEYETLEFSRKSLGFLGGADILIHNASGFDHIGDETGWMRSFQVDMMAGVRLVKSTIETLKESDSASITFVGSMASKFHFGTPPNSYGPSKAAMRAYANDLAQYYGKKGVRSNVISPGAVWFEDGSWDKRKKESPKFYAAVEKKIPLGRLGTATEIARVIAFVASPAGVWINSEHIAVDGGQVASVD